jgi:aminopeptidase N
MSTYLVALLISDFKCKTGVAKGYISGNINVTSCARENAIDLLDFGHNSSIQLIEFFERHYEIAYPLPKLGIPFIYK